MLEQSPSQKHSLHQALTVSVLPPGPPEHVQPSSDEQILSPVLRVAGELRVPQPSLWFVLGCCGCWGAVGCFQSRCCSQAPVLLHLPREQLLPMSCCTGSKLCTLGLSEKCPQDWGHSQFLSQILLLTASWQEAAPCPSTSQKSIFRHLPIPGPFPRGTQGPALTEDQEATGDGTSI